MPVRHLANLSVHHSDAIDSQYNVAEKAFPPGLLATHTQYNGQPIQWMTNFGYQHKPSAAPVAGRMQEPYDIELNSPAHPAAQLVYFDGAAVQPLATRPSDTTPGKVKATLDLGDPPIGWSSH